MLERKKPYVGPGYTNHESDTLLKGTCCQTDLSRIDLCTHSVVSRRINQSLIDLFRPGLNRSRDVRRAHPQRDTSKRYWGSMWRKQLATALFRKSLCISEQVTFNYDYILYTYWALFLVLGLCGWALINKFISL